MVTCSTPNSRAVTRTLQYVAANETIQEVQGAATNGTTLERTLPEPGAVLGPAILLHSWGVPLCQQTPAAVQLNRARLPSPVPLRSAELSKPLDYLKSWF